MSLRRWFERVKALGQGRRLDRELDDEIAAHLELAERDGIAAGHSAEEARRLARLRFGGVESVREQQRELRSVQLLDNLWRDARYALATLARQPGFTAVTVSVLALGIGATAVTFSLVDAVLLKPLPFAEPDRIVRIWEEPRPGVDNATSTLDFLDWVRMADRFSAIAAELPTSMTLSGVGDPIRVGGKAVSAAYFDVFATRALRGRLFGPADCQLGAAPVVVLGHAAWQTYFGGDDAILSRAVILDGIPHQVIGILPAGPFDRERAELWTPLVFAPDQYVRGMHWLGVVGRLREGATLQQAREQMLAIDAALESAQPPFKRQWTIVVVPLARVLIGEDLQQTVAIGFGAAALVLLIACANVANLLIARGASRRKELAVRAALGAGRSRLIAQLLTEGFVLCALGGAAGVAVAYGLLQAAQPFLAEAVPYTADVSLDIRVLAFVAAVVLGIAVVVGTLPSVQTKFGTLARTLSQSSRSASGGNARMRRVLVVAEVALSLVLICAAGLLLRTVLNLQRLDPGVRVDGILTMSTDLPASAYPTAADAAQFYERIAERLTALPGVTHAGLATQLPLRWISDGEGVLVPGISEVINVRFKRVDPGYFAALDIPVIAGRGIASSDRRGARVVAVINQALASRLAEVAGLTSPVGRTVSVSSRHYRAGDAARVNVEIVGVIRSERVGVPWRPDPPVIYIPLAQLPIESVKLLVRAEGSSIGMMAAVREAFRQVAPGLPVGEFATMATIQSETYSGTTRPAWVIGGFALVATLLAALGLYAVLAHLIVQRRREIGIRVALGANGGDIIRQVLGNAMTMVAVGLAVGLAGVFWTTRVMKTLLYEVSPLDPATLAAASVAMLIVGALAAFVPARRAAHVDPVDVLREDY